MINLKLYGKPSSRYEYVKMMMIRQAKKAGIVLNIEEINDLDAIISEEIESIPAIKVNNHIDLRYHENEDINAFIRQLNTKILKEENYGIMKKIIVPTDFSETATNACVYAQGLAKDMNGILKVVHSYMPRALNMEGAVYIDPEIEKIRKEQLDTFVENMNKQWVGDSNAEPFIEKEFITGFAGKEIPALSKSQDNCMIVVGSTGSGGSFKTIFGSISTLIAKDSSCPVFVIPPETQYKSYSKIAYAADDPNIDKKVIEKLAEIASLFNAELILAHVNAENSEAYLENLKEQVLHVNGDLNVSTRSINSDTILHGLNEFTEDEDIDLMILTKQKRTFLDSLFHASVTKKMTINTKTPLLVLHR